MKTITKKIVGILLLFLSIFCSLHLFTQSAAADDYRIEKVCSNGVCIVTVYNSDGAIVNVYEELDSTP
ncbi:MAG TPA: hypothetical protein PK605_15750 [Ignavibacteria bacterium]|nr:hypothetical protein [Ignavibacteria bacterium]HRF66444.1 hypothetical protein [Ignavibacteria bacterium]HRJ05856.1 hypothetical protein [Ignavibacteria bacterium]HRJ86390.1 hypothetical protein [Ignavibacteria bacterium]